jgi:hypothetical protein
MAKMQVKRIGVFSYAKITAITNAAVGLLIGIIYGVMVIIFGAAMMAGGGRDTTAGGGVMLVVGLLIMIGFPIMSGIAGFIAGAIGAVIYNVAAGFVGGLELEMENVDSEYASPPSPQWGNQYSQGQQQPYPYS